MSKSITAHDPCDPKNTLIVDSLNLAFRWKHSKKDFDIPHEMPRTIQSLARSYDCGTILVLGDGGSKWRNELHPGYKATRRAKYAEQTKEEQEDSEAFFNYVSAALEKCAEMGMTVIKFPGVEADDIATAIVENKHILDINDIWLISSDKDWDLLIEEDVSRFSTVTRKEVTIDNWDHPVPPEQFIDLKVLTGDKGDDVPGVDGVGPVRAAKVLQEYDNIFDIVAAIPLAGKQKFIQSINESGDTMLLAHQLMSLRDWYRDAIGDKWPELVEILSATYKLQGEL